MSATPLFGSRALWFLGILFVVDVLLALLARTIGPLALLAAVAVFGPAYRARSDRLAMTISAEGVEFNRAAVPWENIARIENRRASSALLSEPRDVFVLSKPLEYSRWIRFGNVRYLPLGAFDPNWRHGPIGHDIQCWAPRLLVD
jgi:hypothetical protein